jgi:hypothetical protein
MTKLE